MVGLGEVVVGGGPALVDAGDGRFGEEVEAVLEVEVGGEVGGGEERFAVEVE